MGPKRKRARKLERMSETYERTGSASLPQVASQIISTSCRESDMFLGEYHKLKSDQQHSNCKLLDLLLIAGILIAM